MDVKDLMIGDYVEFPIGIDKVVDIIYVVGRGLCASFAASATLIPVETGKLKPIPLTTEILEKNGFKFNKEETYGSIQDVYKHYTKFFDFPLGKGFYIEYDTVENTAHITDHWWIRIKYVHELQHALRLCGITKEIEL